MSDLPDHPPDPAFYDPVEYWDRLRSHETDASPSVGDHTALIFLAGAIKYWWQPGLWDSPLHRKYVAHRNDVRKRLIEAGYLTYAPHEAFKGTWVEAAQAVNDAAIRACSVMLVLSPFKHPETGETIITDGTDDEVRLAQKLRKPVYYHPPGDGYGFLLDYLAAMRLTGG